MKLQISFDLIDLDQAITIASQVYEYADIFGIGTLLIYKNGLVAVERFKQEFPDKTIFADIKIADRGKESASLFTKAACDWITVLAGTNKNTVHAACSAAHENGKKVMLDLLDSHELGQSALEAKNLGADALLIHQPFEVTGEPSLLLDKWEMVRSNTDLPIFLATRIKRDTIADILKLKPDGIILSRTITSAENPQEEALFFYQACH